MSNRCNAFAALVLLLSTATFALGQGADGKDGNESLGGQLLEGMSPAAAAPKTTLPANVERPANRPQPPSRFDDLGDDAGAPSGPLPLVRARQSMSQAGTLLAKPGSLADARVEQQRAVAQLDELINQLCKQCQGGNCSASDKPPQLGEKPGQPKQGQAGQKPGTSNIGPRNSTADLKRPEPRPADLGERQSLVKRVWGQLPERSREQMQQTFSGEFLPKYELDLEKYYRHLAEEPEGK